MADPNAYQPDEQDLKLARLLDQSVDSVDSAGGPQALGQDPLLPFLAAYKSAVSLKAESSAEDRLWQRIEQSMENMDASESASTELRPDEHSVSQTDSQPISQTETLPGDQLPAATGPRPWRQQKPVIRKEEPVPRMTVRWLPLLTRVAAMLALVVFMWLLLTRDQVFEPELIAQTGSEKQTITLLDGSRVTLRPYSELHRISEVDTEQIYLVSGEGYFEIAAVESRRQFVVLTEDARVSVTGTHFTVGTWDRHTRVFLEQGSVLMSLADGSSETTLHPGETGEIVEGSVITSTEIPSKAHLGWLNEVLVLDRRPLVSIIREIRQHFNVHVVVPADLADFELSGSLALDDPGHILQDLALSIGATLEQPEPGLYILSTAGQN